MENWKIFLIFLEIEILFYIIDEIKRKDRREMIFYFGKMYSIYFRRDLKILIY